MIQAGVRVRINALADAEAHISFSLNLSDEKYHWLVVYVLKKGNMRDREVRVVLTERVLARRALLLFPVVSVG